MVFPLLSGCVDEKIMLSVIVRLLEKLRTFTFIRFFFRDIQVNTESKVYCDDLSVQCLMVLLTFNVKRLCIYGTHDQEGDKKPWKIIVIWFVSNNRTISLPLAI